MDPGLEAARDGDWPALEDLLARNEHDPTVAYRHGTSLLWAAGSGHLDICRELRHRCAE